MADEEIPQDDREDMLSILRNLRPYYFWILIAQVATWGVVVFLSEEGNCADAGYSGCAVTMGLKMSGLVPLMLLVSVLLVDIWRYVMVLLRHPREREIARARNRAKAEGIAEGKAEGKAEGIVEGIAKGKSEGEAIGRSVGANKVQAKWSEWNARRIEHERRGDPFDEPPPSLADCIDTDDNHR